MTTENQALDQTRQASIPEKNSFEAFVHDVKDRVVTDINRVIQENEKLSEDSKDLTKEEYVMQALRYAYIRRGDIKQNSDSPTKEGSRRELVEQMSHLILAYPLAADAIRKLEDQGKNSRKENRRAKEVVSIFNEHVASCLQFLSEESLSKSIQSIVKLIKPLLGGNLISEQEILARIKGQSAELAVRHTLEQDGLELEKLKVDDDLNGNDIIASNNRMIELAIDVKTEGAFYKSLKGRELDEATLGEAQQAGYFIDESKTITASGVTSAWFLFNADHFGVIRGGRYTDKGAACSEAIARILKKLENQHRKKLSPLGKAALK